MVCESVFLPHSILRLKSRVPPVGKPLFSRIYYVKIARISL
jgi:hypothetical protein